MRALAAEFIGTFILVSVVCGVGAVSGAGAEPLPWAFATGLTVTALMTALGPVSGGHFNPAITLGLAAAGRHRSGDMITYILAQVLGAAAAAFVWYVVALETAAPGRASALGIFAANGFDSASPGHFNLAGVAIAEALATAILVLVFVTTSLRHAVHAMAPVAVGAALAALLLVTIPISNGALNPARATATALFGGQLAMSQLWLFWAAPFVGAVIGGLAGRWLTSSEPGD